MIFIQRWQGPAEKIRVDTYNPFATYTYFFQVEGDTAKLVKKTWRRSGSSNWMKQTGGFKRGDISQFVRDAITERYDDIEGFLVRSTTLP